jgi:hypothetical protein
MSIALARQIRSTSYVADNRQTREELVSEQIHVLNVADLAIVIRPDADGWTAVEYRTGLFGEGDGAWTALRDLVRGLVEMRDELEAQENRLGEHLREQLAILERSLPG